MQPMTWPLGRLGSRFSLLFEPGRRRVMHSALGRFLDQPLDLAVGLIEPDGVERVLPFTEHGEALYGVEQFERINSITFRGYSQKWGLRFELNFHSPFYPQDQRLCLKPIFYVELRVMHTGHVRLRSFESSPDKVRLFIRLKRPNTRIEASAGRIDLSYDVPLDPRYASACGSDAPHGSTDAAPPATDAPIAHVVERLQSLNESAAPHTDEQGRVGLTLDLPVTEESMGIKWRLVWAAHTADTVLDVRGRPAKLRYLKYWPDLDSVMSVAIAQRDDNLHRSRWFEKLLEQAPLNRAQWHLLVLSFQSYLSNTWWCRVDDDEDFFSVWEGNYFYHNTLDVAYNLMLFYLALWPKLLSICINQWTHHVSEHPPSGGAILNHDMGRGFTIGRQAYGHLMPVEENCNFLLMLQAYCHWCGDVRPIRKHADLIERTARYLLWSDRDGGGFPSEGTANTLDDGSPAVQFARRQTYLAVKRACALDAAADLLRRAERAETADRCAAAAAAAAPRIEAEAWRVDHYVVSVDRETAAIEDTWSGRTVPMTEMKGWDDYSIYTTNGLLLPALTAQPLAFDRHRLGLDLFNSFRETLRSYGCGHTSSDQTNIWISQNLWRDFTSRYLHVQLQPIDSRYWDLITFSNTAGQSFGYIDTYIGNELAFNPRGATAFGCFLAGPRLVVDRLDDELLAVDPDRHSPQRWPLLPLADWNAGRIPVCVVDADGNVKIEGGIEPIRVISHAPAEEGTIG